MKYERFLEPYSPDVSPQQQARLPQSELLGRFYDWSIEFGKAAYSFMDGQQPNLRLQDLPGYLSETQSELAKLDKNIKRLKDTEPDLELEASSALRFHVANVALFGMWTPILNGGEWPSNQSRVESIREARKSLGMSAMGMISGREALVRKHGESILLPPDPKRPTPADTPEHRERQRVRREISRGQSELHEYDTDVVGIDLVERRPHVTFVPTPLQFENAMPLMRAIEPKTAVKKYTGESVTTRREVVTNYNSDALYFDLKKREVVGLQSKLFTRASDKDHYDASRIILVNGDQDFHSFKTVRYENSTNFAEAPYPGVVSAYAYAKTARQITPGYVRLHQFAGTAGYLMEAKILAGAITRQFKLKPAAVVKLVQDRIDRNLAENRG